jgi:hypothetical protein
MWSDLGSQHRKPTAFLTAAETVQTDGFVFEVAKTHEKAVIRRWLRVKFRWSDRFRGCILVRKRGNQVRRVAGALQDGQPQPVGSIAADDPPVTVQTVFPFTPPMP